MNKLNWDFIKIWTDEDLENLFKYFEKTEDIYFQDVDSLVDPEYVIYEVVDENDIKETRNPS